MASTPVSSLRHLAILTLMALGGFAPPGQRDIVVAGPPPEGMDANGDGEVGIDELHEFNRRLFDEMDRNGDGRVREGEASGDFPPRPLLMPFVTREASMRLDADGDGRLSEEELLRPVREMFRRLDRNGDGMLSAEERETGLAPGN